MEHRRPPRHNSAGRKAYSDRGHSFGGPRGKKPSTQGGGRPRRSPGTAERSDREFGSRGANPHHRDSRFIGQHLKSDGRRPKHGKFDSRNKGRTGRIQKNEPPEIKITSDAQITDGRLRGKALLNSDSPYTIPTNGKLREIAFKVLARRIKAARLLDLGSGPGTIGLEAISRGAMLATFVEKSAKMCSFIRKNLDALGVKDGHGEIVEIEIQPFLKRNSRRKRSWDLAYLDLPIDDERMAVAEQLGRGATLRSGGLLLIEHPSTVPYPDNIGSLKRWRTIEQGEKKISVYERI